MMNMKVKFGVHIEPQLGYDYENSLNIALEAEKLGYESFWCSDHLFLNDKSEKQNCMDAWTLLAALAAATKKIRLGTLVTCNNYRHPALLAKIAASIDMISNGRLWFGYGAGWKKDEYKAYGYPFPKIQDRMDMMEEALEIIKLLWTEPSPSFSGKHYSIENAFSARVSERFAWQPHSPHRNRFRNHILLYLLAVMARNGLLEQLQSMLTTATYSFDLTSNISWTS